MSPDRRKWLRARQASLFTEAFERPGSLPSKAKTPSVQYCSCEDGECITALHAAGSLESIFSQGSWRGNWAGVEVSKLPHSQGHWRPRESGLGLGAAPGHGQCVLQQGF